MKRGVNIFIIEDHQLTRERLKFLFDSEPDYTVVGAAESAEEALQIIQNCCPDIIILDLALPGISGQKAIELLLQKCPSSEILIFTVSDDDEKVFNCLKAGATGYILKDASAKQIVEAVDELCDGGAPMSVSIARKVLREFQKLAKISDSETKISLLSPREEQILRLLYQGATYKEISNSLSISVHTVHTHIKRIYQKLHVNSRSQAIFEAFRRGLIQ